MYDSSDTNRRLDQKPTELDMAQLQELLQQQAQHRPLYENVAILGCGYVGSVLADYWQAQGHFVTGTTTSPERVKTLSKIVSQVVLMKGDDVEAVQSLVQGQDTVVVSIAPTGSQLADAATYETTYLTTAQNLLQALEQAPRVKQLIYLSSCAVYGDRQGSWVDENAPISPSDSRGQTLHKAEQIIANAGSNNQKVCILRLGGIYGPEREIVGKLGGLAGLTLPGKGDRIVNWIHLDDIIGAIEFVRANGLEGIYNLVDDSQLTIREQVESVCFHYDLPQPEWDPSQPSRQRKSLRISNQKLKAAGYELVHPQLVV